MTKGEHCSGSGAFPDNFDGEFTRCGVCRRKLNLDPEGLVPRHNTTEARGFVHASQRDRVSLYPDRIGTPPDE